jgi:hypothetical protein
MANEAKVYRDCSVRNVAGIQADFPDNGSPRLLIPVYVPELDKEVQTILYCSSGALPYSLEKLRAAGKTNDDLSDMTGMGSKKFDFEMRYENYDDPATGETRPVLKTNIMSGGGRIEASKPVDLRTFAAKVAMLTGKVPAPSGGAPPPPFGNPPSGMR